MKTFVFLVTIVAFVSSVTHAYDPDPLQDICVAVNDSNAAVFVNGKICKDPNLVTADDFFHSGLDKPGNITSILGTKVSTVFVNQLPGLNTMGIALARLDFGPYGVNPPHEHPRASEILHVVEGTLYAGFILSNPGDPNQEHKLLYKILRKGDVFVFPRGLIHFQRNMKKTNAVAFASFGSQNPGIVTLASSLFGSDPPVIPEMLATAFQIPEEKVVQLQSLPWIGNN